MTLSSARRVIITVAGAVDSRLSANLRTMERDLNQLQGAQTAGVREASRLRTEMRTLTRGTADYASAEQQLNRVQGQNRQRAQSITTLRDRLDQMRQSGQRTTGVLGGLQRGLGRIGPFAAGAAAGVGLLTVAGAAAFKMASDLSSELRSLYDVAAGTSLSFEDLYSFRHAARLLTGDIESATKAVADAQDRFDRLRFPELDAGQLRTQIATLAARAGVSIEEVLAAAETGGGEGVLQLARAFERMQEAAEGDDQMQARLAVLMRQFPLAAQLAERGAAAQDAFAQALRGANAPTQEQQDEMLKFDQAMLELSETFRELRRDVVMALLPALQDIAEVLPGIIESLGPLLELLGPTARAVAFLAEMRLYQLTLEIALAREAVESFQEAAELLEGTWSRIWGAMPQAVTTVERAVLEAISNMLGGLGSIAGVLDKVLPGDPISGEIRKAQEFIDEQLSQMDEAESQMRSNRQKALVEAAGGGIPETFATPDLPTTPTPAAPTANVPAPQPGTPSGPSALPQAQPRPVAPQPVARPELPAVLPVAASPVPVSPMPVNAPAPLRIEPPEPVAGPQAAPFGPQPAPFGPPLPPPAPVTERPMVNVTNNNTFNVSSADPEAAAGETVRLQSRSIRRTVMAGLHQ